MLGIKKRRDIGGSGAISAQFTALQGQLSFSFWLPLVPENKMMKEEQVEKVKGHGVNLIYIDKNNKENKYEAGDLRVCIAGSVYGLAGATRARRYHNALLHFFRKHDGRG